MLTMIDWQLFLSTFLLIFVAELPDKTAFAALFLATSHNPYAVFLGAAGAFVIQSAVAVAFGSVLNKLPPGIVHYASAALFFFFAFQMWRRKQPDEDAGAAASSADRSVFLKSVGTAFLAIFVAEWGDLTQLATATLSAKYGAPLTIFLASTLALWAVTALGVAVGHGAKHLLNPALIQRIAAVAMAGVGVYLLCRA